MAELFALMVTEEERTLIVSMLRDWKQNLENLRFVGSGLEIRRDGKTISLVVAGGSRGSSSSSSIPTGVHFTVRAVPVPFSNPPVYNLYPMGDTAATTLLASSAAPRCSRARTAAAEAIFAAPAGDADAYYDSTGVIQLWDLPETNCTSVIGDP